MATEDAIVELVGGPHDGQIADTRGPDEFWAVFAQFICLVTDHGKQTGKVVQGYSAAGLGAIAGETYPGEANDRGFRLSHNYKVIGCSFVDGRLRIKMEYVAGKGDEGHV